MVPFSYPGMVRKLPGWLLDPLGPVRINPRDFPALLPWFWKFWRAGKMEKVREIAHSQALLMHTVFADFDDRPLFEVFKIGNLNRAARQTERVKTVFAAQAASDEFGEHGPGHLSVGLGLVRISDVES